MRANLGRTLSPPLTNFLRRRTDFTHPKWDSFGKSFARTLCAGINYHLDFVAITSKWLNWFIRYWTNAGNQYRFYFGCHYQKLITEIICRASGGWTSVINNGYQYWSNLVANLFATESYLLSSIYTNMNENIELILLSIETRTTFSISEISFIDEFVRLSNNSALCKRVYNKSINIDENPFDKASQPWNFTCYLNYTWININLTIRNGTVVRTHSSLNTTLLN